MRKLKVFYLATSLHIGGTEKFLVTLAEKLSIEFDITAGVLRKGGALEERLTAANVKVIDCGLPWSAAAYLRRNNIDILQTFLFWAHIAGRLSARVSGTPVVITTQQAVDKWKKFYHAFFDRVTAPLCDYFIANSEAAAKRLEAFEKVPREKIGVVYNGIDHAAFCASESKLEIRNEFNIPPDAFVVACVSRLHYDKGVDFLPDVASGVPGCLFLVAGDGPYMGLLRQKIKTLHLEDRFILCGWRLDTPRVLKASDAFILPSREESFPQAALEAMAMGLPCLASDVGGVSELVEDGKSGILVRPGDITGFSSAVAKLMSSSPLLRELSQGALERSVKFTESRMISQIKSIYYSEFEKVR